MSDKVFYEKIINPFKAEIYEGSRKYQVYIKIEIVQLGGNKYPHFSISGVHAPLPSGNCLGSCGQILDDFDGVDKIYNKGWDKEKWRNLIRLWKKAHLTIVKVDSNLYNYLIEECKQFPETTKQPAWI